MHVILAAGGTGGHLFPALAIGQALESGGHQVSYVGSGRPLDFHAEKLSGLTWKHLKAGRLKGVGLVARLISLLRLPIALFQALIILIQEKPDLVLGLGGYCTGPMVIVARFVGIRTAILEQNCIPGLTNRILASFANLIFIAFPVVNKNGQPYWQHKKKVHQTGNPIRQDVLNDFQQTQRTDSRFCILVFGGSQGAHFLNELMLQLLPRLKDYADRIRIIHITGEADHATVKEGYQVFSEIAVETVPFSDRMGSLYKEADLVISRAGAATISDLVQFGRASVLIPYPFAADLHQHANARYLSDAGAAVMIDQKDLNADNFWKRLEVWLQDKALVDEMARRAQALAPEAPAQKIIEYCAKII